MGDSWYPPLRVYGRESNSVVALPSARAAPAARSARARALRSIDDSVQVLRGAADIEMDAAVRVHRARMAAAAVRERHPGVRGRRGRSPVARSAERLRAAERPHR